MLGRRHHEAGGHERAVVGVAGRPRAVAAAAPVDERDGLLDPELHEQQAAGDDVVGHPPTLPRNRGGNRPLTACRHGGFAIARIAGRAVAARRRCRHDPLHHTHSHGDRGARRRPRARPRSPPRPSRASVVHPAGPAPGAAQPERRDPVGTPAADPLDATRRTGCTHAEAAGRARHVPVPQATGGRAASSRASRSAGTSAAPARTRCTRRAARSTSISTRTTPVTSPPARRSAGGSSPTTPAGVHWAMARRFGVQEMIFNKHIWTAGARRRAGATTPCRPAATRTTRTSTSGSTGRPANARRPPGSASTPAGPARPAAGPDLGLRERPPSAAAARRGLRALLGLLLARPLLAPSPEQEEHAEHDADEQEAPEDRDALVDPAERQRDQLDDPPAERQQRDDEEDDQQDPADRAGRCSRPGAAPRCP